MDQINIKLLELVYKRTSIRQMCAETGLASTASVHARLTSLVSAKFLHKDGRGYRLTRKGLAARLCPDAYLELVTRPSRGHGKPFTDAEKATIRENAGTLNAEAIAALLPNRSVQSVKTWASKNDISLKTLR